MDLVKATSQYTQQLRVEMIEENDHYPLWRGERVWSQMAGNCSRENPLQPNRESQTKTFKTQGARERLPRGRNGVVGVGSLLDVFGSGGHTGGAGER